MPTAVTTIRIEGDPWHVNTIVAKVLELTHTQPLELFRFDRTRTNGMDVAVAELEWQDDRVFEEDDAIE